MMTKKIYFLLTFLLTTIGGGNFALATDYVLSGSTRSGYEDGQQTATYVTNSKTITVTNNTDGRSYNKYTTYPDFIKTSHIGTSTINLANLPSSEIVTAISFKGFNNVNENSNATSYISNVNGTGYSEIGGTNQFLNRENISSVDDEDIKTFTVSDLSIVCGPGASLSFNVGSAETNLIITITTELRTIDNIYSGTYPYTWDFTVETAKWSKSISEMKASGSGNNWNFNDGETEARPTMVLSTENSLDDIDIIKGLRFTTSDANSLCLDYTNRWIWLNGTLRLPALSSGHKVTIVSEAAPTSVPANLTPESTSGNTRQYLATADIATPAFDFDGKRIYSIAVTKSDFTMSLNQTDLTKYAAIDGGGESKNNSTDPGSLANYSSILYDDAHPYIRMKLNLNKLVQSGIGVAKADYPTYFKVTNSSDETVIDITNCYTSQVGTDSDQSTSGKGDRVYIFNVKMLKAGTSNLTFKFVGGDAFGYNENEITVPVVIIKGTQTLSFDQPTENINFDDDAPTNVLTHSVGDGTVTYSSSDTHVASVNETTGALTINNSGTCNITATAAETDKYYSATASYTLTVNGSKTPTLKWTDTDNGNTYTVADLPYGNSKYYKADINTTDGSDVTASDIRYGVVEADEGYLTVGATDGKIQPTRKFADEDLDYKVVQVYAYTPSSGDRNASPRILYNVKIVKGTFANEFFKQTELTVNVGCTIAPKNNLQSLRWEDIEAINVTIKEGSSSTAVAGVGNDMIDNYFTQTPASTYFDTKVADKGNDKDKTLLEKFYPIFHGLAVGNVTFTVTLKSKLYGDMSGDFTLHVINTETTTGFEWASGTKNKYTLYVGDYMLVPDFTGYTNGNFDYSDGGVNSKTKHKYLYTRRWDSSTSKYEPVFNNVNFRKGEGYPNIDLTSDADGNTVVTGAREDGNDIALIFWNTGSGTDNDRLLIYANKPGTVYLKASDPQITTRALSTIEIEVKERTALEADFNTVVGSMTFPYTWDFTAEKFMGPDEDGNGYWVKETNDTYSLDMQSNFNYDYADENKDGVTWSNKRTSTTSPDALTSKLLVSSYSDNSVMRGFAGMKIKLGNNGTGSWYSKRDGIHILPYSTPGVPRLRVSNGTHTLILPTPTGDACPETFKVFVKVKTLADNDATLWVRYADLSNGDSGQTKYYKFKYDDKDPENSRNVPASTDVIYSITATKGQPLELDLDKVDVYWVAYSTEAKNIPKPTTNDVLTYAAASYSYNADLDISKSLDANDGVTAYYASGFTKADKGISAGSYSSGDEEGEYAVKMSPLNGAVPANTGILLKKASADNCYMIVNAKNMESEQYSIPYALSTNYLKGTESGVSVSRTTTIQGDTYSNFAISHAYKYYKDITDPSTVQGGYRFDRNWSFYPIMGSNVNIAAQKAYLQIPGNLYVNKNGEIVDLPASSRASWRAADDDDAPVAPASKAALSIVFEDELPLSPENPDVTGVFDIERHADDNIINNGVWYNMEGMRISTPTKPGLYIRNGKKVFIK